MRKTLLTLMLVAMLVSSLAVAAQDDGVTLRVVGFEVQAEEQDTPLAQGYRDFLAQFQEDFPEVNLESLETPPDFDTQLVVDLAAGTAPDVWAGGVKQNLIETGHILDMNLCLDVVPELSFDRFFPNVLAIHQRDDAIYGLPNDFTPMVIYYNPESFDRAGVDYPEAGWTWDEFVETAKLLTLDAEGRNRNDPDFDEENVVQWGYRVRKYAAFEWSYRAWEAGGELIAPDGSTVSGYLDSPETVEAAQWHKDLLWVHGVSPEPSTLDAMTQEVGFLTHFLQGTFAMFDRGHWELVGLQNNEEFSWDRVAVVGQPQYKERATVLYESGFFINSAVAEDEAKLKAACEFVNAATDRGYQDLKVVTGIAISANAASAEAAIEKYEKPEVGQAFFDEVQYGRPEPASQFTNWAIVDDELTLMMESILAGGDVEEEIAAAADVINRELERTAD